MLLDHVTNNCASTWCIHKFALCAWAPYHKQHFFYVNLNYASPARIAIVPYIIDFNGTCTLAPLYTYMSLLWGHAIDRQYPFPRYYLYQWPLSMTVIVVISIFITLCTCTVLMWVRDVVRDFEIQRTLSIQRRRAMAHQQQQQQQEQQQDRRVGLQVRELIFRQLQVKTDILSMLTY